MAGADFDNWLNGGLAGSSGGDGRSSAACGSPLGLLARRFWFQVAAGLLERPAQKELDLPIHAAQIVVRPALDRFQQSRVNTKEEWFSCSHLLIDGSGVDHRLRVAIAAQHDQQVADHRRLAIFIELDDRFLRSMSSAISTIPTAPSTMRWRAAMIAPAC